jgi:hypothetical protein
LIVTTFNHESFLTITFKAFWQRQPSTMKTTWLQQPSKLLDNNNLQLWKLLDSNNLLSFLATIIFNCESFLIISTFKASWQQQPSIVKVYWLQQPSKTWRRTSPCCKNLKILEMTNDAKEIQRHVPPSPPPLHETIGVHRIFFIISHKQNVHGTNWKKSNIQNKFFLFHGDDFSHAYIVVRQYFVLNLEMHNNVLYIT